LKRLPRTAGTRLGLHKSGKIFSRKAVVAKRGIRNGKARRHGKRSQAVRNGRAQWRYLYACHDLEFPDIIRTHRMPHHVLASVTSAIPCI
jgi:hypothetical protein